MTPWRCTALTGVRWTGCTAERAPGSRRLRPSEKITRVDAFAPAFALAIELLTIANVTSRLPMPGSTCSAMPPHGLPSLAPMKSAFMFSGPKNTVAA